MPRDFKGPTRRRNRFVTTSPTQAIYPHKCDEPHHNPFIPMHTCQHGAESRTLLFQCPTIFLCSGINLEGASLALDSKRLVSVPSSFPPKRIGHGDRLESRTGLPLPTSIGDAHGHGTFDANCCVPFGEGDAEARLAQSGTAVLCEGEGRYGRGGCELLLLPSLASSPSRHS